MYQIILFKVTSLYTLCSIYYVLFYKYLVFTRNVKTVVLYRYSKVTKRYRRYFGIVHAY